MRDGFKRGLMATLWGVMSGVSAVQAQEPAGQAETRSRHITTTRTVTTEPNYRSDYVTYQNTVQALALPFSTSHSYPTEGVEIGQGWSHFTDSGTASQCVNVVATPIEHAHYETDVRELQSSFGLQTDQSLSASVSGGFGSFSGSGSVSASQSKRINLEAINILYSFKSKLSGTQAQGIPLYSDDPRKINYTDRQISFGLQAEELLERAKDPRERSAALRAFQRMCGDGFVSAIHRGTDVRVVASYYGKDSSLRQQIQAEVSSGGLGWSASAEAESDTTIDKMQKDTRFRIFQTGGQPIAPPAEFGDLRRVFENASQFSENASAYEITITPYVALGQYLDVLQSMKNPSHLNRLGNYYIVLSDLYDLTQKIHNQAIQATIMRKKSERERLDYDTQLLKYYGGEVHFRRLRDQIREDLIFLEESIRRCLLGTGACSERGVQARLIRQNRTTLQKYQALNEEIAELENEMRARSQSDVQPTPPTRNRANRGLAPGPRFGQNPNLRPQSMDALQAQHLNLVQERLNYQLQLAQYQNITGVLGETIEPSDAMTLDDRFFRKFYAYLLELPLQKFELPADITKEATDDFSPADILQRTLYLNRLSPWRDYFCGTSMLDALCVSEDYLNTLLVDANFRRVLQSYKLQREEIRCYPLAFGLVPSLNRNESNRQPHMEAHLYDMQETDPSSWEQIKESNTLKNLGCEIVLRPVE